MMMTILFAVKQTKSQMGGRAKPRKAAESNFCPGVHLAYNKFSENTSGILRSLLTIHLSRDRIDPYTSSSRNLIYSTPHLFVNPIK